jgi:hypothetical protein
MEKEYMNTVEQRAHALVNLKQNIDAARDLCVGQHARKVKRERIQARKQVRFPPASSAILYVCALATTRGRVRPLT